MDTDEFATEPQSHRERKTRRQGEGETRRKRREEGDFLLSLFPCPLVPLSASVSLCLCGMDKKIRPED
jgi:hypothetical protein